MSRVKRGIQSKKRKKKIFELAKGYRGAKSRSFKIAKEQVMKSLQYAYRDRRAKKRDFRKLWIIRINAAARINGLSYNRLIDGLKQAEIDINRKMLADIAVNDPDAFKLIADKAKEVLKAS